MKIGVKTFGSPEFLRPFKDIVDFFEIMAVEKNNYDFLKEFSLPIVIHSQHRRFGVNVADKSIVEKNLSSIDFARKLADTTNAKKIILHPGELDSESCSIEQAIDFIKNTDDKRLIIENVPLDSVYRFGTKPEEIKEILKKTKKGFCFDINHALWTAIALKQDYQDIIKEFVKLKPLHYHLGGQITKDQSIPEEKREHLSLREADFDIKEVLKLLPKNAEITLETTTDTNKTLDDVKIMKELMKELKL
jgi:endonuclease IV